MKNHKGWALGLGLAAVSVTGLAAASIDTDRLSLANDCVTKAIALVNAVTTVNKPESRQVGKALKALQAAQADLSCALAREADPKAACP